MNSFTTRSNSPRKRPCRSIAAPEACRCAAIASSPERFNWRGHGGNAMCAPSGIGSDNFSVVRSALESYRWGWMPHWPSRRTPRRLRGGVARLSNFPRRLGTKTCEQGSRSTLTPTVSFGAATGTTTRRTCDPPTATRTTLATATTTSGFVVRAHDGVG